MPLIYKRVAVMQAIARVCDSCGKQDDLFDGSGDGVTLTHNFGYSSKLDGVELTASFCDDCFALMVARSTNHAHFKQSDGELISSDAIIEMLREKQ